MDYVLQETERNRQMVNQIAYKTFAATGVNDSIFPAGPEVCFHLIMVMNFMMFFRCKIGLPLFLFLPDFVNFHRTSLRTVTLTMQKTLNHKSLAHTEFT